MESVVTAIFMLSVLGMILSTPVNNSANDVPLLIIISLDGFRYNYLDRLPKDKIKNFQYFIDNGVKAEYINNIFPSVTFSNHMTLLTGLYAESHGVVYNDFYDPYLKDKFHLGDMCQNFDSRWFDNGGEPVWVTNMKGKGHRNSGSLMWPAGVSSVKGVAPRIIPKSFWNNESIPYQKRIDYLIDWFTDSKNPINFGMLYIPEPDEIGHHTGPESDDVNEAIYKIDNALQYLKQMLSDSNLLSRMNIIITADHGMTEIKGQVNLDLIVDRSWYTIAGNDPSFIIGQLNPTPGFEDKLISSLKANPNIYVYKKGEKELEELHFSKNDRIPSIILEPKDGWVIANNDSFIKGPTQQKRGAHGYDPNKVHNMRPIFIASGPAFKKGFKSKAFNSVDIYPLMCHILGVEPAPNNGSLENVHHLLIEKDQVNSGLFQTTGVTFLVVVLFATLMSGIFCIGVFRQSKITARKRMITNRRGVRSPVKQIPAATSLLQSEDDDDDL